MRPITGIVAFLALFGIALVAGPLTNRTANLDAGPVGPQSLIAAQQGPATATPLTPTVTTTPIAIATAQATGAASSVLLAQEFTLANLGIATFEMVSPTANSQFTFRIPDNWLTSGNSVLSLELDYSVTSLLDSSFTGTTTPAVQARATMRVRLDGVAQTNIVLDARTTGTRRVNIPLSPELMGDPTRREHLVQFTLDARDQCLAGLEARVRVRADLSTLRLEYRLLAPIIDIAAYPRPFFNNPIANQTESLLMVLPAAYTATDLEAAAAIAAGLGGLTSNRLQIRVITADQLTPTDRQINHLMLIGQVGSNALLDSYFSSNLFPARINPDGSLIVGNTAIGPDDGVVQVILHPESPALAVMAVTGQTPEALRKAVQVLTGPPSLIGLGGSIALVSQIRPGTRPDPGAGLPVEFTFGDLGYVNAPIYGAGTQFGEVRFSVPEGVAIDEGAYVEVVYDISDTLRELDGTLSLFMNDTPINSAFLTRGTPGLSSDSALRIRANIPPATVRAGQTNTLSLQIDSATAEGQGGCNTPSALATWFMARPESKFYLPRRAVTATVVRIPLLNEFPSPFTRLSDLSDVAFVLPDQPQPVDLEQFIRLTERLGSTVARGQRFTPRVSVGEPPDTLDKAAYHLIVLGRPSTNAFLSGLNASLPQPFQANSDELDQVLDDVVYRLPPGYDIGVLQLTPSPWSDQRALLVISGTGPLGQENAVNVLLGRYGTASLAGDVVFASQTTLWSVNTRTRQTQTFAPTATLEPRAQGTALPGVTPTVLPVFTVTPTMTLTPTPTQAQWN